MKYRIFADTYFLRKIWLAQKSGWILAIRRKPKAKSLVCPRVKNKKAPERASLSVLTAGDAW